MRVLWLSAVIVLVDQATKLLVVETMYRSQTVPLLGDWLSLTYTENPGMAFGITFGPPSLITFFSIFATVVIVAYLISIRKGYAPYRVGLALVLGGALGNIIDRVFYGALIYGEPLFQGRVVDFIHVNVWRGYLPDALPLLGGKYVALFPIWNVADMSIVVGVVGILIFQKTFHSSQLRAGAAKSAVSDESVPPGAPGKVPPMSNVASAAPPQAASVQTGSKKDEVPLHSEKEAHLASGTSSSGAASAAVNDDLNASVDSASESVDADTSAAPQSPHDPTARA